jgi:hypothetical protein
MMGILTILYYSSWAGFFWMVANLALALILIYIEK